MKNCPFTTDTEKLCPFPQGTEYAVMREACRRNDYGRMCGGIAAQQYVLDTYRSTEYGIVSDLDTEMGFITARAYISAVPEGKAPQEIRSALQRVSFPLRYNRPQHDGLVAVSHVDLILTLFNRGDLETANWYRTEAAYACKLGYALDWWEFQAKEVSVRELDMAMESVDEYDKSFMVGNAVLGNSFVPPLFNVRHAIDGSGLTQTMTFRDANILQAVKAMQSAPTRDWPWCSETEEEFHDNPITN